jgi:hypothetical protein
MWSRSDDDDVGEGKISAKVKWAKPAFRLDATKAGQVQAPDFALKQSFQQQTRRNRTSFHFHSSRLILPFALNRDIPIPILASTSGSSTAYIAFAPTLARGSPTACTINLAETLDRWRADANADDDAREDGGAFAGVIGGRRWREEW